MVSEPAFRELRPVVVDDAWPWYHSPSSRGDSLRHSFESLGCRYLDAGELGDLVARMLQRTLRGGDLVFVPLMSGALVLPALRRVRRDVEIDIVLVPMSKHPFVSLSADSEADLENSCGKYQDLSTSFMKAKLGAFRGSKLRRFVLLDSSTAAGSDARLFFDRISSWGCAASSEQFMTVVDAVGDSDGVAPGPGAEAKLLRPDAATIVAVGFDVIYTSHLRFLSRPIPEQVACATATRSKFPGLTSYWDDDRGDSADIARRLAQTRANSVYRTHARTSRSTAGLASRLAVALADVERLHPLSVTDLERARRGEALSKFF